MRITKVSVKGLFGMFDHEIPINQDSRITIVHGPNGVGKTVLLRMVHGLFNYEYWLLGKIPFDEFRIDFENAELVTVRKLQEEARLYIEYSDSTGIIHSTPFVPRIDSDIFDYDGPLQSAIREELPDYIQFWFGETSYWADVFYPPAEDLIEAILNDDTEAQESHRSRTRFDLLTEHEILEKYPQIHTDVYGKIPDWFARIRQVVNTRLIHTGRLDHYTVNERDVVDLFVGETDSFWIPQPFPAVWEFSARVREQFQNVLVSKFEESSGTEFETRVKELLDTLRTHEDFVKLSSYDWAQEIRKFLLQRTKDEIAPAHKGDDVLEEIVAFEDIINSRLLFKQLKVDEVEGFSITDENGNVVQPWYLSSGEQQLLVLYYQLLFETEPDTLVMIDEPELSMNVVWQRNFLKDLQRIIELRNFDVLIATHSPEVIFDKWDWTVALGARADD